jgi:chromosomal replication initiator protein
MSEQNNGQCRAIWDAAKAYLKQKIHLNIYEGFFSGLLPLEFNSDMFVFGVTDDFFANFLKEHYGDLLTEALAFAAGRTLNFEFRPGYEYVPEAPVKNISDPEQTISAESKSVSIKRSGECKFNHTFNNFVVGEENRYAFSAAQTAAENPGSYNPLYIYGGTGTGKTHLLQAVAAQVKNNNPDTIVCYITTEEFLNQYTDALRHNKHYEFRDMMRKVDMLLVDDVHTLANKKGLQEEFFNTFNTLYNRNKQIILTSDKQPCEIGGLEERLVSRFESGVSTEISPPGFETRLAILKMMQEGVTVKLEEDVLLFLASNISSSVRRLKGAFIRLTAYISANSMGRKIKLSVDDARKQLQSQLEAENAKKIISIETIQRVVAEHFDIRLNDILSSKRPRNIAEPRMLAMYLCREMTNNSFPAIGTAFGKNHATIMNAMKKVNELCQKNEKFRMSVSKIQRQLQSQ